MLSLSLKLGDDLVIDVGAGVLVTVKVTEIRRGRVVLGVTAPREIPVHRRRAFDAIQQQRREHDRVKPIAAPILTGAAR